MQERPKNVSGASRERPGASPAPSGRARRVAKCDPGCQKGRRGAPGTVPRRPKSTPSRVQERQTQEFVRTARSRTIVGVSFRRNVSIFGVVATPANPPKYRACQQKRRFATACCTTSCSHDVTSKNDEDRVQNRSKVDRSRSFGVHRGTQVDRRWSFGVSRSTKVDRSGSIAVKPVELARRAGNRVRKLERWVGIVG